jgi:hypothetical protein
MWIGPRTIRASLLGAWVTASGRAWRSVEAGGAAGACMHGPWLQQARAVWKRVARTQSKLLVPRWPRRGVLVFPLVTATICGKTVDSPLLPFPTDTEHSTRGHASAAAPFAVTGRLVGPLHRDLRR